MRILIACASAVAASWLVATPADAACLLAKMAELPVTMDGMQPMTEAKINGADVRFLIDSGAFYSVISPGNARTLDLHPEPLQGWMMRGINGETPMSLVTVKTFTISGQDIPHVQFIVAGSEVGGAGVLGQNLLGLADAEYDLPHGAVRLMKPKGCEKSNLAYWAKNGGYSLVDLAPRDRSDPHTEGTVFVNGAKIKATFDTGAFNSVLSMAAAARAGITPSSPGVKPGGMITGFGRKLVRTWIASFDSFKVGDQEEIKHGKIRFGETTDGTDMLLGADFFIAHRVYVANSQHRLYLTYEGGPVFNLSTDHRDASGAKVADTGSADVPVTAEAYSRSGAVRIARNDRDGAIADFTKAIALAPTEARYRVQRADAYLAGGERNDAGADLDEAIRLQPGSVDALLDRAGLRLAEDRNVAALDDIDAAAHVIPVAGDQHLAIGGLYSEAGQPARAVEHFTAWIKAHPDDVRRPEALNGRCWARALWGQELPAALADCNAAIRQRPGDLSFLDSRGLVELRIGDLGKAIHDYDMVLAKAPRTAWSLYGRGIAKLRQGDRKAGEADLSTAADVAPRLAARARMFGIAP